MGRETKDLRFRMGNYGTGYSKGGTFPMDTSKFGTVGSNTLGIGYGGKLSSSRSMVDLRMSEY